MNAKELYLTIGQVDDDLILAANADHSKRKRPAIRLWMVAAAACFCLMLGGGYLHFFGAAAVWNAGPPTEYATKDFLPEYSAAQSLSADALPAYYHIMLPDTLADLSRIPVNAQIYADAQGNAVYDRNVLRYESADGGRSLELTLWRVSSAPQTAGEKVSRIHGAAVTLTEDTSIPGYLLLGARWEQNGTTVYLAAEGISRDELVSILKELI